MCGPAFLFEHVEDVMGGAVAEQLAESLLVIRDSVFLDQADEIGGSEACQGGLGEVRIGREEVGGLAMNVGEVTATTSRDENLAAGAIGALEYDNFLAPTTGFDGAHEPGGAATENERVESASQRQVQASGALSHNNLAGDDGLADVTLGVIGDVDEQTGNGCRRSLSTDRQGPVEVVGLEGTHAGSGISQSGGELGEQLLAGGGRFQFGLERGLLPVIEPAAFGVGQQAINAARDMAQLKSYGSQAGRPSVEFFVGECGTPMIEILPGEFEGMHDGPLHRGNVGMGSTQPGFKVGRQACEPPIGCAEQCRAGWRKCQGLGRDCFRGAPRKDS